jgi:hypothetical protein
VDSVIVLIPNDFFSVVNRHRFGADPDGDPDPTFHFDADPDPDTKSNPDPTLIFTHVGKSENVFTAISCLHCFIFLVSVIGVIMFNILDSKLKF